MFRRLLGMIGVVEVLWPERLIAVSQRLAFGESEPGELRSWVVDMARGEGLVLMFVAWRSDTGYRAFKKFIGLLGMFAALFPHAYVDYGSRLVYADASEVEWKPWVYRFTRVIGVFYVLVGLRELGREAVAAKKRAAEESEEAAEGDESAAA